MRARRELGPVRLAAGFVSAGALLSGPIAMAIVTLIGPQPRWSNADSFVAAYHPIQALPYLLGYLLLSGFVLFAVACHTAAAPRHRIRTTTALVFTTVYAALVFLNYTLQIGFVPRRLPDQPALAGALTMANPNSFAWFLEMFGYAAMGIATALIAPLFGGSRRGSVVRRLLYLNGLVSVVGAACTGRYESWVFSASGLTSFAAWNVVVICCFGLIAISRDAGIEG